MKTRTAVIITTCAIAIAVASVAFNIVQNYQRNSAYEKMYEQLRIQGYGDEDEYAASLDEDSLCVDSVLTDTLVSMDLPDEATFKIADMAQEMLEELHYPIVLTDTFINKIRINFMYEGEHMMIVAEDGQPGIIVEDRPWDSFPYDNTLALYAMYITINRANSCFPFKILYFEEEGTIRVLTRQQLLINEFTPDKAKLLESSVKSMVRVHEYFQNTMVDLIQEFGNMN